MPSETRAVPPVPVEERLFSLVLALLATESGLTKNEILSTVQGYRQRFEVHGDNASLERQFERDKDDIRELGVPLETLEAPGDPGNNQSLRYRIPRAAYELPADISFSPEEITLLNLAAMAWREGSLSRESRRALLKLRSIGADTTEPVLGYAPRIRTRDAAFGPLSDALARGLTATFLYLKPGSAAARLRTVQPLALVQHQGRWHLKAFDQGVGEPRTFLLSRISGAVKLGRQPLELAPGDYAAEALAELDALWEANVAEIEVVPGTDAAVRLSRRRGAKLSADDVISLHFTDAALLADELSGFGPEVLVRSPDHLVEAVKARLRLAVDVNSEGTGGDSDGR
ncbi:WYL domain-containing protein [Herbiconiux sp. CPCC 203407]|uniref:WYL domain-containing protein n=1 Tax=Herbiconiux oxytropis TaxID=2970915 RepID=A0AA41XJ30_9MICO|nr:WYL domain-containing protein [Herbiconiux oxytropis]MCS5721869.1 WYL domain-containing protein [Herbiconiux oxytropis]MCS5727395.1 WYL domain-containing protein [Herbiconiux oxytropis]